MSTRRYTLLPGGRVTCEGRSLCRIVANSDHRNATDAVIAAEYFAELAVKGANHHYALVNALDRAVEALRAVPGLPARSAAAQADIVLASLALDTQPYMGQMEPPTCDD